MGRAFALARVAVDISGRPWLVWKTEFSQKRLGEMDTEMFEHFFHSLSQTAGLTLHIETLYGQNNHHIAEACFKGVARALRETGVPPGSICLEVTETAVLRRPEVARRALDALRVLGVRVALDDFGLGYSSLTHLKALPVDVVKVDRSFVADLVDSTQDRAVVEAVLTLARRMGLTVIAEGVETAGQDELLREMGCPMVQGYLYGRPAPPEDVLTEPDRSSILSAVDAA